MGNGRRRNHRAIGVARQFVQRTENRATVGRRGFLRAHGIRVVDSCEGRVFGLMNDAQVIAAEGARAYDRNSGIIRGQEARLRLGRRLLLHARAHLFHAAGQMRYHAYHALQHHKLAAMMHFMFFHAHQHVETAAGGRFAAGWHG